MVDILKIRRRALGGAAGAPGSLAIGELAFNEQDAGLYIGRTNGTVVQVNAGTGTDNTKVLKAGDTMTGNLTINAASPRLYVDKTASGQAAAISGRMAGGRRWSMSLGDTAAETGSNAGSDFTLDRFDDGGTNPFSPPPLTISRATGNATLAGDLTIAKVDPSITFNKTASGQNCAIGAQTNGSCRWWIGFGDGGPETGSNAGSNFSLNSYSDTGAYITSPISITRSNSLTMFSGDVWIRKVTPQINLDKSATTQGCSVRGNLNGVPRWGVQYGNASAESGGNTGTDFAINRYDDGGTNIGQPLNINRATGNAIFSNNLNAGEFVSNLGAATGIIRFGIDGSSYLYKDVNGFTLSGGNITINGDVASQRAGAPSTGLLTLGNGGNYLYYDGGSFIFNSSPVKVNNDITIGANRADGVLYFGNSGARYLQYYSPSGTYYLTNGALNVGGDLTANNVTGYGLYANAGGGLILNGSVGTNPYTCTIARANPNWDWMYIQGLHFPGVSAGMKFTLGSATFELGTDQQAYKSGGSNSWIVTSDARIKNVVGDYKNGLAAVVSLKPVRYTFKGNDTTEPPSNTRTGEEEDLTKGAPKVPYVNSSNYVSAVDQTEYIGLVAQDAELLMPEVVIKKKGHIDGLPVDDLRSLDTTPLLFALVNAIKELKARIEVLEAK
jgi:hypothetical protein